MSQGTFVPVGRQDILTTALGRPEHPGRVRTAGRGVGLRQFFGSSAHHSPGEGGVTQEQLQAIREEIRQELRADIMKEVRQELASFGLSHGTTNPQPPHASPLRMSTKGSCAPSGDPEEEEDFDLADEYELYVENPVRSVAIGHVYDLGPKIHNKAIENDKLRVVVIAVIDANAAVPVPTEEVQTVGQAPNNFILWPRRLVKPISHKVFKIRSLIMFSQCCLAKFIVFTIAFSMLFRKLPSMINMFLPNSQILKLIP